MHFGATIYTNRNGCWSAVTSMKEKMFLHLQDLDFSFHTSKSSGGIIGILKQ
jgi:ABC-type transport system involved in Fe-S cluster assembly fused permease/ATPase subunit